MTHSLDDALVSRLRAKMKRAEPLPWVWEQCGEKEDCPVIGVAFDENEQPLSGMLDDHGDEIMRWNIASGWGSGIDSSAPSANADFVVESVNAIPALLDRIAALEAAGVAELREDMVERLWIATMHGDDEHRTWLREAFTAFFAGKPVPEPRGKGRKEAMIAELREENGELRAESSKCASCDSPCSGSAATRLMTYDRVVDGSICTRARADRHRKNPPRQPKKDRDNVQR